uniref:Uncharacterized protein n=1 Tax=Chaetoceros debilis TaxID=122233 RepID=A0A7S3QJK6_9STRA|mmetsp:Transcript_28404/g.43502  ORF Transcript_28404/g.43502 Transcript_28404/m.43502 type:complete len:159 (+) Transcript_28404:227-703(+)
MVSINFTYLRTQRPMKRKNRKLVLAKGEWILSEELLDTDPDSLNGDQIPITISEDSEIKMISHEEERVHEYCCSTRNHPLKSPPSPTPTTPTYRSSATSATTIEYTADGTPENIYVSRENDDDEWSVSTLGSTIIGDARPGGRRLPFTSHENLMIGTF